MTQLQPVAEGAEVSACALARTSLVAAAAGSAREAYKQLKVPLVFGSRDQARAKLCLQMMMVV